MGIIDTHLHLWNPAQFQYPWLAEIPALQRNFALPEYREACGENIAAGIFVECDAGPDSFLDEARWALEFATDSENQIAGVVASLQPEREDFQGALQSLLGHPRLKGLRRVLQAEPDALSQASVFRENVRSLAGVGLNFDLCVRERQLPLAIELADACTDTAFILDHCGCPDIAADSPDFWRTHISEIARRPNMACKISGLLLYAKESQRTAAGIFPWFSHVVEVFGWDRIVWGGDWPVCTLAVPLGQWLSVTQDLLDMASANLEQRTAFLAANAKRIYHL